MLLEIYATLNNYYYFTRLTNIMINKVLVAVAGRGLCEQMLNMLMDLPYFQQASVTVLHVIQPQATAKAMS